MPNLVSALSRRLAVAAFIAAALLPAACQTPPDQTLTERRVQAGVIPEGKGRLYVYRAERLAALSTRAEIFVDGQPSGIVPDGSAVWVDLSPGKHRVAVGSARADSIDVEIREGREVFVRAEPRVGTSFGVVETDDPAMPDDLRRRARKSALPR